MRRALSFGLLVPFSRTCYFSARGLETGNQAGILTIPVVAVAQGPVSVVVEVVVTYEYCCNQMPVICQTYGRSSKLGLRFKRVHTTVLVPELIVEVVVDCFTERQEHALLMREGVGYALM